MRPAVSLCLLAVFALGASLCNRRLPARRQQASSSEPLLPTRPLTPEEAIRLCRGRVVADAAASIGWGLPAEDAARIAMAWPANVHPMPERLQ